MIIALAASLVQESGGNLMNTVTARVPDWSANALTFTQEVAMTGKLVYLTGLAAALVVVTVLTQLFPESNVVSAAVTAVVVLGAGLGALVLRKRRESITLSAEPDSIETVAVRAVQASTFIDALILTLLAGLAALWFGIPGWVTALTIVTLMLVDFWVRWAVALRGIKAQ